MKTFTADNRRFLADGKPYTVISGAIHYFRVHPDYWYDRLLKLKECGFNTVETYVCWNLHEPEEGKYDFTGMLDLGRFLDTAAALGLNAIVRPGPYICSEWDFGGFPAWLLKYDDVVLRCMNEPYLRFVRRWFKQLFTVITPRLLQNGGNVMMLQIENEYGSYGDDKDYLRAIAQMYREEGADCLFFTSDGDDGLNLSGGSLPEYVSVINFGSEPDENFANLAKFRTDVPLMCGEYWCGWFDSWHSEHHRQRVADVAEDIKYMLSRDISFNMYMFHGGTNFGFTNGANYYDPHYTPDITSYDYSAPLSENGDRTPLYYALREVIAQATGTPPCPLTAADTQRAAYGTLHPAESAALFDLTDRLPGRVHNTTPLYMEDFGADYGYALYSASVPGPFTGELDFDVLHDRAVIFFDGKLAGVKERSWINDKISLTVAKGETVKIDILCENMGRVNYGPALRDRKGISGIRFNLRYHFGWDMLPLTLKNTAEVTFTPWEGPIAQPCFLKTTLHLDQAPKDTFLKISGLKRGAVLLNGFNLGRYYCGVRPQEALYVPAPLLRQGDNELVVFESQCCDGQPEFTFTDTPSLDYTGDNL